MTLVLASASPRRRDLLRELGLKFRVVPSAVVEREPLPGESPEEYAKALAREKATDVAAGHPTAVTLAADTVVAVDGHILGKPRDAGDAERMLRLLAGKTHAVVTAVCVRCGGHEHVEASPARVSMRPFTPEEARAYVATGEPADKAGAYAVQGRGGQLVDAVSGCYNAVVGLPLCLTTDLLRRCGLAVNDHRCRHRGVVRQSPTI